MENERKNMSNFESEPATIYPIKELDICFHFKFFIMIVNFPPSIFVKSILGQTMTLHFQVSWVCSFWLEQIKKVIITK